MLLRNYQTSRARNSARIRESIVAMILVASRYENQFLSLNYVVNTTDTQNFDSRKLKRNSTPDKCYFGPTFFFVTKVKK